MGPGCKRVNTVVHVRPMVFTILLFFMWPQAKILSSWKEIPRGWGFQLTDRFSFIQTEILVMTMIKTIRHAGPDDPVQSTNEWINKWMNEWSEWIKEWKNEGIKEWIKEEERNKDRKWRINEGMNE